MEDWFLSAMLGFITAILSISVDVSYEYLNHCKFKINLNNKLFLVRVVLFDLAREYDLIMGFGCWIAYLVILVGGAALVCRYVSVQAIGIFF